MNEDGPSLGVGFEINFHDSFGNLKSLDDLVGKATADIVRDFERIRVATSDAVQLTGSVAAVRSFGHETSRAEAEASRSFRSVERAGEAMVKQLERQNQTFGLTRSEIRSLRVEERVLAAQRAGMTELADRLIAQETELAGREAAAAAAADEKARAALAAAAALKREADEQERLAAMVRNSHAAQMADAEAAERMRMATDPLYASTVRLNAEIAESTRLYHAGATAPVEYARQQQVLRERLDQTVRAHAAVDQAVGKNRSSMTQLSFQVNDVVTMAAMGAPVFQIFASQAGQIIQVAQMAEGGVRGFVGEVVGAAVKFAPFVLAAGAAAGAFSLFDRAVSAGVDTKAMINGLGLTRAEIKRLKDTTVDTGDVVTATFQVMAERVGLSLGGMNKAWGSALDWMTTTGRNALASLYANYVGTFRAIGQIVEDVFSGKGINEIVKNAKGQWTRTYDEANAGMVQFGKDVTDRIILNKMDDFRKQAASLRADRTAKADKHAEALAREAAATEAQIRNLYSLADAYRVSSAEALIAEARTKAESDSIKKQSDFSAAFDRQLRLSLAERVSETEKASLGVREQARAQEQVNAMVAAGLVPAERAQELVQQRLADLPILAAIEAAQQKGLTQEAERANKALGQQIVVRERLNSARRGATFAESWAAGESRLADLQMEFQLLRATEVVRTRAIAADKAEREARARTYLPDQVERHINQQVAIAEQQLQLRLQTDALNDSLRYQADLFGAIADNVNLAGQGMAEAFGSGGRALGELAGSMAGYLADQERLRQSHDAEMARINAISDENLRAQREREEMSLFTQRGMTAQIGLFGDMASAAKGFFKEGTDGYGALLTAEKVFRTVEFAMSVRAMAQDAAETVSSIANSGLRTAKLGVEAVVKAISSLPFPLNFAAGAATVGVLASLGVGIAGSFGGSNLRPETNTGTGTVLGDADAKSESVARALDQLADIDTLMLRNSREMLVSLRSIDSQIGGFASLVLRTGDVNASAGIATGFNRNLTGDVLSTVFQGGGLLKHIPIIGDIFGGIGSLIGSLFGTKTKIVGSGLFGDAQSLGDILASGYDADYYSDVQKKKKFFGLTTSTKYSTRYTDADPGLENQFTLILRSFNSAIVAAAGPLGEATDAIQQRLNGFVLNIGRIDLQGLTGEEIKEKLSAVFGAAADDMGKAAFPGIERFQQVGEGLFETLVRVSSTVETVDSGLGMLGVRVSGLSTDMKVALAGQFDSIGDFSSAIDSYFDTYFTKAEQAAARTAQFADVFDSLGLTMPGSLAAFRDLVQAQNLATSAGQATYATLLQLAPAFADLQAAMNGAKSAADIISEREDLQRQLLQAQGDTAAIRRLELAGIDASNRALQEQIWAIEDAKEAAEAAQQLKDAWLGISSSLMDEVKRIRGLTDPSDNRGFAYIMSEFNKATALARGGDQDAAKSLTGLSQQLLTVAGDQATSRQELLRVQAQVAGSLETTADIVAKITGANLVSGSTEAVLTSAATASQAASPSAGAGYADLSAQLRSMGEQLAALRQENTAGHAATASNTGRSAKILEQVAPDGDYLRVGGA